MPSPKSSTKANKHKKPLLLRRIVGSSMSPKLPPGRVVLATGWFRSIKPGEVCIFQQDHKEKIKRVERISKGQIFFIGDNLNSSSDSRHFGWIKIDAVLAKVIWPRVHN